MAPWLRLRPGHSDLAIRFLSQNGQQPTAVAAWLVEFIHGARHSLDLALYDARLDAECRAMLANALHERAAAGVAIRFAYDADKPEVPILTRGMDPASGGTGAFIQSLGYPFRRIGGPKLMHHKYVVRDPGAATAAVWTGSTNWTTDAWSLQENNIVVIGSPTVATAYAQNFADLWREEENEGTGDFDVPPITLHYHGLPLVAQVHFSPGRGLIIDETVAACVANARRRIRICSMLLNSGTLLNALLHQLHVGQVPVDGIYDQTQMAGVFEQWAELPHNAWKVDAVQEIVATTRLVGKVSHRYRPTAPHDFMHNKILVVDDTVITGSYNFSRSAQFNAENLLMLESATLADEYSAYIDRLIARYHS